MTYKEAQDNYGIQGRSTVLVWLRKHGRLDWTSGALQHLSKESIKTESKYLMPEQRTKALEKALEEISQKLTSSKLS
ncbi:hypothetical protein theurythT_26420 [Thalassotalea eurytherma]|uniref:Transposase n=1 Tax=Thalassotalea eurytherma TaxID=1144278 RepID=A0ABQ6H4V8_9GAMM|nr:hypothetical protein theurythT_26420 [Thalassotalea eurytherma]